jgi:hypothetical protein
MQQKTHDHDHDKKDRRNAAPAVPARPVPQRIKSRDRIKRGWDRWSWWTVGSGGFASGFARMKDTLMSILLPLAMGAGLMPVAGATRLPSPGTTGARHWRHRTVLGHPVGGATLHRVHAAPHALHAALNPEDCSYAVTGALLEPSGELVPSWPALRCLRGQPAYRDHCCA